MRKLQAMAWGMGVLAMAAWMAAASLPGADEVLGQKVYESKCASCHGKDGKGDTRAGKMTNTPDITAASWKQGTSAAELEKTLKEGLGKMPKYEGKLTAEELKAVIEYTRKLAGVDK